MVPKLGIVVAEQYFGGPERCYLELTFSDLSLTCAHMQAAMMASWWRGMASFRSARSTYCSFGNACPKGTRRHEEDSHVS